jgi:DNA-binding LacI/PurR family transcriptional regulator
MTDPNPISVVNRDSSEPLHKQIALWIREQIDSGVYGAGTMLPSTKSLRETLGRVNHLTVRQAVSALTKEGLLFSIQGKGTFVADRAKLKQPSRRGTVGLICSALADGFAHQVVLGAESCLRRAGYELMLCNSDYSISHEAEHLRRLHGRGVDGILLVPFMPPANKNLIETLRRDSEHPIQVVCIDRGFADTDLPLVDVDNKRAAYEAVSYLIALGHKRIGFIVNALEWIKTIAPIKERFLGYRQALHDNKIAFDRSLVQEVGPTLASRRPQDLGLEHYGYQAMHKLLMLEKPPTGVLLLWDELAPGAIAAIRNSRLNVPRDVSLIGFNDDLLARLLSTPLTTVHQPAEQIGQEAAKMIVELIEGRPPVNTHHTLGTHLVIRATTNKVGSGDATDMTEDLDSEANSLYDLTSPL